MSELHQENVRRLIKSVYQSVESSLDNYLFEPNHTQEEGEFAIQNCAMAFESPNFIAVTVGGRRYSRPNKMDFIEDMRMNFADNPGFVIDGVFEYRLDKPITCVTMDSKKWSL